MKIVRHVQRNKEICAVILVAALARLLFLFDYHEIWWDSGVYAGMAKYLWSAGSAGLWENIRPVLWPLVIGLGWFLKLNLVWFARILEFFLFLVSVWLVYALGVQWFSRRAGIIASVVWAFSSIVFYLGFHEYTELPAVTFVLAALFAFTRQRWFLSGLLTSIAFLTKFPAGVFIVALGIAVIAQKQWRKLVPLGIGFAIPTAAFLFFNKVIYGEMLGPLVAARESILGVLGCNVLRFKPWWQYFSWIFLDNWLNVLALLGIGAIVFRWKRQYFLPILAFVLPAAYFMQLHCREYRYLALFLPFVALMTGHGTAILVECLEKYGQVKRYAWTLVVVLVFAVSVFHAVLFYHGNEARHPDVAAEQYYHWLEGREVEGEIWSSNPVVSIYTDAYVNKVYYPLFSTGVATGFNEYLREHSGRIGVVLLDNCGGGLVCPPDDVGCWKQLDRMRSFLKDNFKQVFSAASGKCWYEIYSS